MESARKHRLLHIYAFTVLESFIQYVEITFVSLYAPLNTWVKLSLFKSGLAVDAFRGIAERRSKDD